MKTPSIRSAAEMFIIIYQQQKVVPHIIKTRAFAPVHSKNIIETKT